jgi:hypothetical protein
MWLILEDIKNIDLYYNLIIVQTLSCQIKSTSFIFKPYQMPRISNIIYYTPEFTIFQKIL